MNYIYHYLENLCNYTFKPEKENEKEYNIIIKKMVESILNVTFRGKLDELFSEEIPKIENDGKNKTKNQNINDILYVTLLPNIIKVILN